LSLIEYVFVRVSLSNGVVSRPGFPFFFFVTLSDRCGDVSRFSPPYALCPHAFQNKGDAGVQYLPYVYVSLPAQNFTLLNFLGSPSAEFACWSFRFVHDDFPDLKFFFLRFPQQMSAGLSHLFPHSRLYSPASDTFFLFNSFPYGAFPPLRRADVTYVSDFAPGLFSRRTPPDRPPRSY